MKTNDIKKLYLKGWTRVQIAEEICYSDKDIDFETAMLVVEEVLLQAQRRWI